MIKVTDLQFFNSEMTNAVNIAPSASHPMNVEMNFLARLGSVIYVIMGTIN